jgi:flavodoxin
MKTKPLIVYYSKTGTTAKIVKLVLPTIKAEIRKLEETSKFWRRIRFGRNSQKEGVVEDNDLSIGEFDPIILLTPVWNGKPTPAMNEFLEKVDLKGKRVVLGLVGANETNPDALERLRRKAIDSGSIFIETIYLRGVTPGRDWSELKEEDYIREAFRLAEKFSGAQEFTR